jgi:hypothetical protein
MQIEWEFLHPQMTMAHLGYIPYWLHTNNPKGAVKQINDGYTFGGWQDFDGFKLNKNTGVMRYPGDPDTVPLAKAKLREETIYFYQSSWVSVVQPDGSFRVARID